MYVTQFKLVKHSQVSKLDRYSDELWNMNTRSRLHVGRTMKIVNLRGQDVDEEAKFVASRDNGDGTLTAFFAEDIDDLVSQMKSDKSCSDIPDAETFQKSTCSRQGARNCARGSCPSGMTCTLVSSGSFSYCRCS